ncbi:hypothetical protein O9992_18230 [Vibrio lentus]|nr:hypothetical protein [Vibrio lentus]
MASHTVTFGMVDYQLSELTNKKTSLMEHQACKVHCLFRRPRFDIIYEQLTLGSRWSFG